MYQDNFLNYYAFILITLIVIQNVLSIYTNKLMSSLKTKNVMFEGSWLKNPLLSNPNFNSNRLYKNMALVSGVEIAAILFFQYGLNDPNISAFSLNAMKYLFGFLMFFSLDGIITALQTLFQAKHYGRPEYMKGRLEFSLAYIFKLRAFINGCYALILWSLALLISNTYLFGAATFFTLMSIRDLIGYNRFSKKTT